MASSAAGSCGPSPGPGTTVAALWEVRISSTSVSAGQAWLSVILHEPMAWMAPMKLGVSSTSATSVPG